MRELVKTLLNSLLQLVNVFILLGFSLLIFAIFGLQVWSKTEKTEFDSIGNAFLTLFHVISLDRWFMLLTKFAEGYQKLFFIAAILVGHYLFYTVCLAVMSTHLKQQKEAEFAKLVNRKH